MAEESGEERRPADPERYALIVGGSRGIGAATARILAEHGYTVAITYNTNRERAEKLLESIRLEHPRDHLSLWMNVESPESIREAVYYLSEKWGRLDVLVYSAGILSTTPLSRLSLEEWEKVVRVNLTGAYLTLKMLLPLLLESPNASVVMVSSIAGETGNVVAGPAYAASKAGLIGLVKRAAVELAPYGIRVNAVAPSFVETDMTRDFLNTPEKRKRIRELHPLRLILKPEDVAKAILFLADPEWSRGITGHILSINAGRRT